jgi:Putative heavy-metal chelation
MSRAATTPESARALEQTMKSSILNDTLEYLDTLQLERSAVEVHLTRYFTTAELDDGSIGACMSYLNLGDSTLKEAERVIQSYCRAGIINSETHAQLDREIAAYVQDTTQRHLLLNALMVSIASAMSAPFIRTGGDDFFKTLSTRPPKWTDCAETALVVGLGGFLHEIVTARNIRKIHVLDLKYRQRRNEVEAELEKYRRQNPKKTITASAALESLNRAADFDLLSITGSTLANGSLESFLKSARKDATVILQGQSAGLHPKILFETGITWIATTLKPKKVSHLARLGYDGLALRPLFEGGLPWLYLLPRGAGSS